MNFDDDIPVLTDVLRTRTGRMHAPDPRLVAPPAEDTVEPVDLLPLDLVIGHDARTAIEPYTTTDFGANEMDPEPRPTADRAARGGPRDDRDAVRIRAAGDR